MARTRAANPAAELASPAAVGKLFSDTTRSGYEESLGRDVSADSSSLRSVRRLERQASVRLEALMFSGLPFRVRVSPSAAG
jgi:hypothetical protein